MDQQEHDGRNLSPEAFASMDKVFMLATAVIVVFILGVLLF